MIKKLLKYAALSIATLLVLVPSTALLYRKYLQHKISKRRAITTPNGINTLDLIQIGGINQWIEVRGQNVNNPILLFIHGGPGIAFIPLAGAFDSEWENHFTVVQWDQRGAGKTYTSNSEEVLHRTMNVPQMEQDTLEVANYLRNRFKRDKIFLVGHSWGSVLGLWLAHEHPGLIYAYVGVGQVVDMAENDAVAYQDALQRARETHNDQAIKDLESIAPYTPPDVDQNQEMTARSWEGKLLGPPPSDTEFTHVPRILTDLISAPQYSLADDINFIRGQSLSMNVMLPQVEKIDMNKLGFDFRAPIFFFEGRHDPYCRPSLVFDYTQKIRAPQKQFIWFENSGHFPFYEERQEFTHELIEQLLPLAH